MPTLQPLFHALFPALNAPIYTRASFLTLTLWHIGLVFAATLPVVVVGIAAGIFVTRESGRDFAGILDTVTAIGQTFPPAAVLAIAVPLVGYGAQPTVVALIAYGILPVVDNTIAGLRGVSPAARGAAEGMGFTAHSDALLGGTAACRAGDPGRRAHLGDHQYRHRRDRLDRRRAQPRLADHRGPFGLEYRLCHPGRDRRRPARHRHRPALRAGRRAAQPRDGAAADRLHKRRC